MEILTTSSIFGESLALMKLFGTLQNQAQDIDEGDLKTMGLSYEEVEGWLRDPYLHFKAWATSIAALHRPHLKSSLDFRLQDAVQIKEQVLNLLRILHDSLIQVQSILSQQRPNEWWMVGDPPKVRFEIQPDGTLKKIVPSSASWQAQSHEACELQELLSSSKESVSSLLKLSVAIRSSPARDDYAKAAARYDVPSFWDTEHVKAKHGGAKYSKPWLLKRLGEAITLRRKYLTYREEHNRKLLTRNEGLAEQVTNDGHTVAPTATHTLPSTMATRIANDAEQPMRNVDITLDDETARSQTSYEPTRFEGGESTSLIVPKPPERAFEGVPFEYGKPFMCPYCFTEQNCRDRTVWKRHVFRDLKPYVCTFADCGADLFSSQHDWFLHEIQKHRREWACQSCKRPPFQSSSALRNHMLAKHPNIAPKEDLPDIVAQCEEPINRPTAADCPLCDEWENSFAKSKYNDFSKLRKHLGRHMEQLALFALPRAEPDGDRSDEEEDLYDGEESDAENQVDETAEIDVAVLPPKQSGTQLLVTGISVDTTEPILREYFMQFGPVIAAKVGIERGTGRGFGIVLFESKEAVDSCLLQPHMLLGKPIDVTTAPPNGYTGKIMEDLLYSKAKEKIEKIQQHTTVMPDRMRWMYKDPEGQVQGPWSGLEMHDWHKANFFPANLPVRRLEDLEFETLGHLIRRIGSREPFLVPQIGVSYGPEALPAKGNSSESLPTSVSISTADQRLKLNRAEHERSDKTGKQANWPDIDDDDDWAPETIEWTDGTKSTLPQAEEGAGARQPNAAQALKTPEVVLSSDPFGFRKPRREGANVFQRLDGNSVRQKEAYDELDREMERELRIMEEMEAKREKREAQAQSHEGWSR